MKPYEALSEIYKIIERFMNTQFHRSAMGYVDDEEGDDEEYWRVCKDVSRIVSWLRRLSTKPTSEGEEAKRALDELKNSRYKDFLKRSGVLAY